MSLRCVFLIGKERSGTTALRSMIASSDRFVDCHELFAPHDLETEFNSFGAFVTAQSTPRAALLLGANRQQLFEEWVTNLNASTGKMALVDVKYGSINVFDCWWRAAYRPSLLQMAECDGFKYVHMFRRNKLAILASLAQAEQSAIWVQPEDQQEEKAYLRPVDLNLEYLVPSIEVLQFEENAVRGYFAMGGGMVEGGKSLAVHPVEYESLFAADENIAASTRVALAGFLGIEPQTLVTKVRKQDSRPLSRRINNFARVEEILRPTAHAWMLDA